MRFAKTINNVACFEHTHLAKNWPCDVRDRLSPLLGSTLLAHPLPPHSSDVESKPIYGQHLKKYSNKIDHHFVKNN
jgi:hypothetical protein